MIDYFELMKAITERHIRINYPELQPKESEEN